MRIVRLLTVMVVAVITYGIVTIPSWYMWLATLVWSGTLFLGGNGFFDRSSDDETIAYSAGGPWISNLSIAGRTLQADDMFLSFLFAIGLAGLNMNDVGLIAGGIMLVSNQLGRLFRRHLVY